MIDNSHMVFISYATPDRDRVSTYYTFLKDRGFEVWMDCYSIKPGQNWDFEIKRALDKSSFVIAFISQHSYRRRGYVQRELKIALDKLSEKLVDDIYIIPVVLDEGCEVPDQLKDLHYIADSDPRCKEKVSDSISHQLKCLGIEIERTQQKQDIYWSSNLLQESWEGLPGYEFEAQLLSFSSTTYPNLTQVSEYLRGHFLGQLFRQRSDKLQQLPAHYNYGQDQFFRTNTYDAHCGEPCIKGKVMTVTYAIHWYGAGAAHPNYHCETFSFLLDPLTRINSLQDVFLNPAEALLVIQNESRMQLYAVTVDDDEKGPTVILDKAWIDRGTSTWDNFAAFVFGDERIELFFAPYQVAAYAVGMQFAQLEYATIAHLLRSEYRSALGIEHLAHR